MRLLPSAPCPSDAPSGRVRRPVVERLACWSARHRKIAVAAWLAFMAAAFIAGQFAVGSGVQQYDPGQAGRGEQVLTKLGVVTPPTESVLIQARAGEKHLASDAAAEVRKATLEVEAALTARPHAAADIHAPYHSGSQGLLTSHGTVALVTFKVAGPHSDTQTTVLSDLAAVRTVQAHNPDLLVREAGSASTDRVANALLGSDFRKSEWTSVPLTLILLLAVFGALIAAGIPVLLAGTAVVTAVSLLGVAGRWFPVGSGTSELVLVIGMAVGIDYSLFYLRREREERMNGHDEQDVVGIAAATSGRAILVSGLTVMVSLAGLFLTGIDIFTGIAFGTIMVVGVAVLGSLFFLPALLSWLGPWADRLQLPYLGRRLTHPQPSRLWAGLARRVVRRPLLYGGIAAAALLALSAPALGMRLANPSVDLPSNLGVVQVLAEIQHEFPAKPAPADVVVSGANLESPAMQHQITALRTRASAGGPIHGPVTASAVADGKALVIEVPLAGNGSNKASNDALLTLRGPDPARHDRQGAGRELRGDRRHSVQPRPAVHVALANPDRLRDGGAAGVHLADARVPQPDHSAGLYRAQLPLRGRGVWPGHADLPGRAPARHAWLHVVRRADPMGAAVHVRDAVRPEHGLPRVHPEPDQRVVVGRRDYP